MKCPHCAINFHDNWITAQFHRQNSMAVSPSSFGPQFWQYRTAVCPACNDLTIELARFIHDASKKLVPLEEWLPVYPIGANRGPVPPEIPEAIATDYIEACNVLPISPKASAALSRRCLQNVLHAHGYKAKDLAKEIDALLNEADAKQSIAFATSEISPPTPLMTRQCFKSLMLSLMRPNGALR